MKLSKIENVEFYPDEDVDKYLFKEKENNHFVVRLVRFREPFWACINPPLCFDRGLIIYDNFQKKWLLNDIMFQSLNVMSDRVRILENESQEQRAITTEIINYSSS